MKVSFETVNSIYKTLPTGYYLGRKINHTLSETSSMTAYNPFEDAIIVSYPTIARMIEQADSDRINETYGIDSVIRGLLYHEVSHAILTSKELCGFAHTKKEHDIVNIVEDERIETLLATFFLKVDFKRNIVLLNNYRGKAPVSAWDAFYQLVRYHKGEEKWIKALKNLIITYKNLNATSDRYACERYHNAIMRFYNDFTREWNEKKEEEEKMRSMMSSMSDDSDSDEDNTSDDSEPSMDYDNGSDDDTENEDTSDNTSDDTSDDTEEDTEDDTDSYSGSSDDDTESDDTEDEEDDTESFTSNCDGSEDENEEDTEDDTENGSDGSSDEDTDDTEDESDEETNGSENDDIEDTEDTEESENDSEESSASDMPSDGDDISDSDDSDSDDSEEDSVGGEDEDEEDEEEESAMDELERTLDEIEDFDIDDITSEEITNSIKESLKAVIDRYTDKELESRLTQIIELKLRANKAQGAAINAYGGRLDYRSVAKRDDYKWWVTANRMGNLKGKAKVHITLLIDNSGSFWRNDAKMNVFIRTLDRVANQYPDFTFDVITINTKIVEWEDHNRIFKSDDGNRLLPEIATVLRKHKKADANNYLVALFDGDAHSDDMYCNYPGYRSHTPTKDDPFKYLDESSTIIISDEENRQYITPSVHSARVKYCKSYVNEFIDTICDLLERVI